VIVLRGVVTWEVFSELHRAYPGLRILAHRALLGSFLVACSLASVAVTATRSKWACPELQCVFFVVVEAERFVNLGLAVFTLLMFWALARLPVLIPRSTVTHARYWSVRLIGLATAMVLTLIENDLNYRRACNIGLLLFLIGSNIWWIARMRKEKPIECVDVEQFEIKNLCRELSYFRRVIEITQDRLSKVLLPR
jgi:hypothetical protein